MAKWEYIIAPLPDKPDILESLGNNGWEICGISNSSMYLKRIMICENCIHWKIDAEFEEGFCDLHSYEGSPNCGFYKRKKECTDTL